MTELHKVTGIPWTLQLHLNATQDTLSVEISQLLVNHQEPGVK